MKLTWVSVVLLVFVAAALMTSCGSGSSSSGKELILGQDVTLKVGETAVIRGTTTTLRLDEITEDTRDPFGVIGARPSYVTARMTLAGNNAASTPFLVMLQSPLTVPAASGGGASYHILMRGAEPAPTGALQSQDKYRLTFNVTSAE